MARIAFEDYWRREWETIRKAETVCKLYPMDWQNDTADYYRIEISDSRGSHIGGKYIVPKRIEKEVPLVLHFHDYDTISRSWFHLSRYAGIGCGVLAADEPGLSLAGIKKMFQNGLLLAKAGQELSGIDKSRILSYGDGAGAAAALVCAAFGEKIKACGAFYPLCCDFRTAYEKDFNTGFYRELVQYFRRYDAAHASEKEIFEKLDYFDLLQFAPYIKVPVLFGVGMQDTISPPESQLAVFERLAGDKKLKVYPKHGHELNNFFENEWLKFLLENISSH